MEVIRDQPLRIPHRRSHRSFRQAGQRRRRPDPSQLAQSPPYGPPNHREPSRIDAIETTPMAKMPKVLC